MQLLEISWFIFIQFLEEHVLLQPILTFLFPVDYSDDPCRVEFTKGQEARMRLLWYEYRATAE